MVLLVPLDERQGPDRSRLLDASRRRRHPGTIRVTWADACARPDNGADSRWAATAADGAEGDENMGAGATPPGWYPDVERPGGERYWNGVAWTEDRRPGTRPAPQYGAYAAPQTYGAPQGYQPYGAAGSTYPKSAVAGWALGLSIAGLVLSCCGGILLSIPGTIMGWTQMKAVDRGERDPASRGTAKAAFIVGLVGIALFATVFVLWGISVAVGQA